MPENGTIVHWGISISERSHDDDEGLIDTWRPMTRTPRLPLSDLLDLFNLGF